MKDTARSLRLLRSLPLLRYGGQAAGRGRPTLPPAWWCWLLLPLAACAAPPPPPAPTAGSGGAGRIEALIGSARCTADSDCRTSPIGQQACGGPAGHVAWSVLETESAVLQAALEQHQTEQRKAVQRDGRMSTCRVVTDPGAYCAVPKPAAAAAAGRCTLRPAGSAPVR